MPSITTSHSKYPLYVEGDHAVLVGIFGVIKQYFLDGEFSFSVICKCRGDQKNHHLYTEYETRNNKKRFN